MRQTPRMEVNVLEKYITTHTAMCPFSLLYRQQHAPVKIARDSITSVCVALLSSDPTI